MKMRKAGWTIAFAMMATGAMAGSSVIPNPDSDVNVTGPNPGNTRGPCIIDGRVLQDCAPRNFKRDPVTGSTNQTPNVQRLTPMRKNGSTVVPLNN